MHASLLERLRREWKTTHKQDWTFHFIIELLKRRCWVSFGDSPSHEICIKFYQHIRYLCLQSISPAVVHCWWACPDGSFHFRFQTLIFIPTQGGWDALTVFSCCAVTCSKMLENIGRLLKWSCCKIVKCDIGSFSLIGVNLSFERYSIWSHQVAVLLTML